jgi:uncharacterized membrane protein YfcA
VRIPHAVLLDLGLFFAGVAVSIFGSIVGLGGGFVLVPLLRLFFGLPPALVAGTSLALVVTNNATASITYFFQRRIAVRTALLVAAGGLPGSVLGAALVKRMPVRVFDWLLAILILAVAVNMLRTARFPKIRGHSEGRGDAPLPWTWGIVLGFAVGVLSGLFGAGGGVVLIAALFYFTKLSLHEVTATAQFALLFISAFGLGAHGLQHDLAPAYAIPLVLGGALGGPIGASISARLKPKRLTSVVALALVVAALALVARDLVS